MKKIILLLMLSLRLSIAHPTAQTATHEPEIDSEKSRKIIGQSVVTSVSVIMNGDEEPHFTDAVGKTVPRPFLPPQVASPINLLNPDRYEFYTFNDKGELVKRLMTLREIQSIVANGNGAMIGGSDNDLHETQSVLLNTIPLTNHDSDTKVQDIVDNVQNVLSREMENNKNLSSIPQDLLDTPNVSSSWSMILPAIFGNTGDEILPHKPINMTPETEIIDTTTSNRISTTKRTPVTRRPATRATTKTPKITTTKAQKLTTTRAPPKTTTTKLFSTTTKLEQKTTQPPTTTTTKRTTRPALSTTKRPTVKVKPTAYRSTTRRPTVSINEFISSKENENDETTKTVLITSRPFTTTTRLTTVSTKKPFSSSTSKINSTTANKKQATAPPMKITTVINNIPTGSIIKDSEITKIEMMPIEHEKSEIEMIESKYERISQAPTTVLSTVSKITRTTQKPTTMQSVKIETVPPTSTTQKIPSSTIATKKTTIQTEAPSSSPTVLITSAHPIVTEKLKPSTLIMSPIKLETYKPTTVTTTTTTATSTFVKEESSTAATAAPSSEEIRQDLAISQIIGSLQNDMSLNHLFQPFETPAATTVESIGNEETTMSVMEKSSEDINLVPDKIFLDNQLYIDEKDPITKEIPTTTEMPIDGHDDTTTIANEPHFEKFASSTTVKSQDESTISLENSEVMQTIEKLIQEHANSKNKINLEKLDVLGFDDDDETEIKFIDPSSKKKNQTQFEHITKATTVATSPIVTFSKETQPPMRTTTESSHEEIDTTIPTILSEALSNVIEQMMQEQEARRTSTEKPTTERTTVKTTQKFIPTTTPKIITTTTPKIIETTTATTTTASNKEQTEPSLDELNKLLHHYQELSSKRDELVAMSLLRENSVVDTTPNAPDIETTTLFNSMENTDLESKEIVEEKSTVQNNKIYSEYETSTVNEPEPEISTATEDPSMQEFTTYFYVSDDVSAEASDELGVFTTEQFVASEKRISNRRNEFTTVQPSLEESEEGDIVSSVLNAIGIASEEEEENKSTEKSNSPIDSDESDEVVSAIASISSSLDKTLQTDIKTDFSLTSKIANSLISVADSISETFNGDNESEETTEIISITTVNSKEQNPTTMPNINIMLTKEENENEKEKEDEITISDEQVAEASMEMEERFTESIETSDEVTDEIATTTGENQDETTLSTKYSDGMIKSPRVPIKNKHKESGQLEKDDSSPMIQLSIIRKEDSLEKIDIMTPSVPSSTEFPMEDGNFIKIESIETTSVPKLSGFKNKTFDDAHENVKPIYIAQRGTTTAKSSSFPEVSPLQISNMEKQQPTNEEDDKLEPITERVPLIEKATKDSSTSAPIITTDDNLVQIKIQTKPTVTLSSTTAANKIIATTLSNVQSIKDSIKHSQQIHQPTRPVPIDLSAAPKETLGLAASTASLSSDLSDFSKLCNELAFTFWKSITADGISQSRSVVISPFALTSTLSMIFLGARGQTSGEMNDLLRLDDTVTFNPHVVFRNISESVEQSRNSGIAAAAFARELYSDRSKGKLLPYFKEKAQQYYGAHVEEVNFNVVNDIIRRRTNLLVKRHTYNKIKEYLKTNNIWVNEPLAAVSANVFMTDCSQTTNLERDGEMFFQVSPAIRQRRLVPIPAAVYRSGFTAGYDPILDATAVAFGDDLQSTILVMPGQQGSLIPGDNLERLENAFLDSSNDAWGRLLGTFIERPGLEVQIPRFSHRSLINTSYALQQMGLKDIFNANKADLRGLTGSSSTDLYFSDLMQINQFTTCGEDKIADSHHIEIYPSPALKRDFANEDEEAKYEMASIDASMQYKSLFYDPIYDSRYINVPLPLRPRQARLPENPRLRFDRPFLYFVRHNPTGIILFMGRFNPRLLP